MDNPLVLFPGGFEECLAFSRLYALACGKHWGWRQVAFIALLCGIPILMDHPIFTPYFPFVMFKLWHTRDQWQELPEILDEVDDIAWWRIKRDNQEVFDRFLSPDAVARYMLATVNACLTKEAAMGLGRESITVRDASWMLGKEGPC